MGLHLNDIITELSKPVWWVSVVVAGIVINLISGYLKSSMDFGLSKIFNIWNERTIKQQNAWNEIVDRIRSSDATHNAALAKETRARLQSIHLLLISIFISNFTFVTSVDSGGDDHILLNVFFYALSAFTFFVSFLAFLTAAKTARAIQEAKSWSHVE